MKQKQRSFLMVLAFLSLLLAPAAVVAQDDTQPPADGETPPATTPAEGAEGEGGGDPEPQPANAEEEEARRRRQQQQQQAAAAAQSEAADDADDREDAQALGSNEDAELLGRDARSDQDDAEEGQAVEPAATEQLPWRNTLFIFDQGLTTYTIDPGLSENGTYAWSFSLRPRWYLNETVFLRVRQDMELELTDSDGDTYNRRPLFADTQIDIVKSKLLDVEGYTMQVGGRISLPLSLQSQANEQYFGTTIFQNSAYAVDGVMEGLRFTGDLSFSYNFAGSNVAHVETPYPCFVGRSTAGDCDQVGGPSTVHYAFSAGLGASLVPVEKLSVDLSYSLGVRRGRELAPITLEIAGAEMTFEDESRTHWRYLSSFSLGAGYDIANWLNASLSWTTQQPLPTPEARRPNPFLNSVYSTVSLTATVTVDQLYTTLSPRQVEGEAAQGNGAAQAAAQAPARAW